jgi:protoheme IX farnesyltransferase
MTDGVTITDPRDTSLTLGKRLLAYVALTKPRIIELLLITTVPAMLVAEGGWPDTMRVVLTVVGGTLSAGGANAINNVVDRDIDAKMRRTRNRPLPAHRVSVRAGLVVGLSLGVAGFVILWLGANLAAPMFATAALGFYVLVYTLVLKRTTTQNIVIGGAAGAIPAVVGWTAVTGSADLASWVMFGIVFAWTPAHFWALAIRFKDDYEAAGVPMLPVVATHEETGIQIVLYAAATTGLSLMLQPLTGLGLTYLITAMVAGAWFVWESIRLLRNPARAMLLFRYSNVYLTVVFAAMALDALI